MNSIEKLFQYEGQRVRTVVNDEGVLFVAKDVCEVLEILNSRDAVGRLNSNQKASVGISDGSQMRRVTGITEAAVYKLVFRSNKPEAETFTDWITEKVIPSIRKNGSYEVERSEKTMMQKQRSEAMLLNSKTRQAKLLEGMISKFGSSLDDTAIQAMISHSTFILTGERIVPKPSIEEKHYTATEIAKEAGTSANKIGRLANSNEIKVDEYGKWVLDKSRSSDKQVQSFLYNDLGRRVLIDIYEQDRIKRVK